MSVLSDGLSHVSNDASLAAPANVESDSERADSRRAADVISGDGAYGWKIGWTEDRATY